MNRSLWIIGALVSLANCSNHEISEISAPVPEAQLERIYVATQRAPDQTSGLFGASRSIEMNYGVVDVSIPPDHTLGQIEWARNKPDPARHFAVVNLELFSGVKQLQTGLKAEPPGPFNVTNIYVHGFNTSLHEALFRLAQIKHDFQDSSPAVLFAWPSAARSRAYVYDRDSVLFARDDLVKLLRDLTAGTNRNVAITGHSMGAQLTMEALRQIAISGDRQLLSKIAGVILVAPDIDPEVFRRQAQAIGKLPDEFYIFVAKQDQALRLSAFLTGRERVGVIQSAKDVEGLDVTVIDFSSLSDGKNLNHQVGLTSPDAIKTLSGLLQENPYIQKDGVTEYLSLGSN